MLKMFKKMAVCALTISVLSTCITVPTKASTTMKSWKFDFGPAKSVASGYTSVTADMKYTQAKGYGFLGLGTSGYLEDSRSDGFTMLQGQEIKLKDVSKPNVVTADDDAIGVTDPTMPIRFAVYVTPNTYYKVKVTLTGSDQTKDASINLFSEKRHQLLTEKVITAGTNLTYEFNVNVQNVFSKITGVYEDTMLNIEVGGVNAAISSAEIQQIDQGKTLWVLGDSTVWDQISSLPYFNLQNYGGVGQALSKYLGPDIAVSNHGESGLEDVSSKPHFDQFKARIKPGDTVYFEFGHNHKVDGPPGYYAGIPYYYDYIHQIGANLIVVGPIDRHQSSQYNETTNIWSSTLDGFSTIGKQFVDEKVAAGATDIAFVDLNAPTLAWFSEICKTLGQKATSTDYYFKGILGEKVDGTHPNDAGVDNFAKMFFDAAKATVNADPTTPQAKVLSDILVGLRDETPYTVPTSITNLGPAPNSAYPQKYISQVTYDYPLVIKDVALATDGKILSMSATKQADFSTYGRGIVAVYNEDDSLKGVVYANEQIDNTLEGTQTVTFTTNLKLGSNEKLKAFIWGFKDEPGYPLTMEPLANVYSPLNIVNGIGWYVNDSFDAYTQANNTWISRGDTLTTTIGTLEFYGGGKTGSTDGYTQGFKMIVDGTNKYINVYNGKYNSAGRNPKLTITNSPTFANSSGKDIVLSMDFNMQNLASGIFEIAAKDSSGVYKTGITVKSTATGLTVNNGSTDVVVGSVSATAWYNLKITANRASGKYSITILNSDGTTLFQGNDYSLANSTITGLSQISFGYGATSVSNNTGSLINFDNLKLYSVAQ